MPLVMMHVQYFLPTVQVFPRKKGISVRATTCTLVHWVTIVINLSQYGEIPSMQHVIT